MMTVKTVTRGQSVTIEASNLKTSNGSVFVSTGLMLHLRYKTDGADTEVATPMVDNNNGVWSFKWDSSVADSGEVFGHVRSIDDEERVAYDFTMSVVAGRANRS